MENKTGSEHDWGKWEDYQKAIGRILVKTYPLKKQEMAAKEPAWTLQLEEWGRSKKSTTSNMPVKKEVSYIKKLPKEKRTTKKTETPTATRDNTSME